MGEEHTFQKHSLWERSSHDPLVIAGPGVEGGRRCGRVTSLLDLYPTLVAMCGLPPNEKDEGRSLVPRLEDPDKLWPYPAVIGWKQKNFAIRARGTDTSVTGMATRNSTTAWPTRTMRRD